MSSSQSIMAGMPNSRIAARGSSRTNRQPVFNSHVEVACAAHATRPHTTAASLVSMYYFP